MIQPIALFERIYTEVHQAIRWKVSDKRVSMAIAASYVMNEKTFDLERFLGTAEAIKSTASLFSAMRSQSRFMVAAMLDVHCEQPSESAEDLFSIYQACIKAGFSRGAYSFLCAAILLTQRDLKKADYAAVIEQAKAIHRQMKKEHAFLTSAEDYPLAVLLACQSDEDAIKRTEYFYDELSEKGFRRGNDLQFASHILGLALDTDASILSDRMAACLDQFKLSRLKPKPRHYPLLAMLAFLPPDQLNTDEIRRMHEELGRIKSFKWQKDMNLMFAASFFAKSKLEHSQLAETSLFTTLEAILQAQQAAIAASVMAASASSANSGN